MKYVYIFAFSIIGLVSCNDTSSTNNSTANTLNEIEKPKTKEDEIDYSKPVSTNDSQEVIKAKLKKIGSLDNKEFGEVVLFDDYFDSEITKYFLKDKTDDQRSLTVVIYNNKIRYMKLLIQHIGDTNPTNIKKHKKKIKTALDQMIDTETYKRKSGKFMTINENGETWNVVWLITTNKKTKTQDYWMIMCPENEFLYLKHMVNEFSSADGFETELL